MNHHDRNSLLNRIEKERKLTGSGTVSLTNNVGHTGLVGNERGQMDGRRWLVLGERLDLSTVAGGTFLGVEGHGPMTGS